MTKLEKIKEAWVEAGADWKLIKYRLHEDGGFLGNTELLSDNTYVLCNLVMSGDKMTERPKSLTGIENNRGWIKIESEDDLPKEQGTYLFYHKDGSIYTLKYSPGHKMDSCTHWKLIVKDLPPIY